MEEIFQKDKIRIDQYLTHELDISRSKVQKLIKESKILVNNNPITANYVLKLGDKIDINTNLDFNITIKGENIPLDIVYEDKYLLIINKPSGMVVHPASGNYEHTLVNALIGKYNLSHDSIRPGIVHRIDKDTSGLLVVAKDDKTHELLADMIKHKTVERKYLAIVDGTFKNETGTIDAPIGRDKINRQKMMVTDIDAKNAITYFKVLERFKDKTLIECKLATGRTHQIRVHMAYINHPIVNDPLYGKTKQTTPFGQMLHSYSIKFTHPITKQEIYYQKEPPIEFQQYLEHLRNSK